MIKFRKAGILLIFQVFCFSLYGQNVEISGNAPAYKGEKIEFFLSPNPIIHIDEPVGECFVDTAGNFFCELNIEKTCRVYVPLGIYRGYLYVIPGNRYDLSLPQPKKKTIEQELNPYFREFNIHLGILNEDKAGLNYLVKKFDDLFYPMLNDAAINAYIHKTSDYNSIIDTLNSLDDSTAVPFYYNYKRYNIELLKIISSGSSNEHKKLFSSAGLSLDYNNPSCIALINQVFNNYFSNLARTKEGKRIYIYINRDGSYFSLLELVKNDLSASNDSLPELVILKSIFEGYYQEKFSNTGLFEILDSLQVSTKIVAHRIFAKQIREDITRLMKGFPAPDFALENTADSITELNALKGKYVYLGFCSARSYPCMRQFRLLNELLKKFSENLAIVIVMVDNDISVVKKFAQDYGFEGIVLIAGTRNDLLKQYKIKSYPTYYLIDLNGIFLLSSVPTPEENFESVFRNILLSSQKSKVKKVE